MQTSEEMETNQSQKRSRTMESAQESTEKQNKKKTSQLHK